MCKLCIFWEVQCRLRCIVKVAILERNNPIILQGPACVVPGGGEEGGGGGGGGEGQAVGVHPLLGGGAESKFHQDRPLDLPKNFILIGWLGF